MRALRIIWKRTRTRDLALLLHHLVDDRLRLPQKVRRVERGAGGQALLDLGVRRRLHDRALGLRYSISNTTHA